MNPTLAVRVLDFDSPEQRASVDLRRRVLRAPLGLEFTEVELRAESVELHFAAFRAGHLVGILLFRLESPALAKMRQVAIEPALQGSGIGAALIGFGETELRARGFTEIRMHARETACAFYERLGYRREGARFLEVGIPHFGMSKRLSE